MKVERHYLHGVGKNENVIKNKKDQDWLKGRSKFEKTFWTFLMPQICDTAKNMVAQLKANIEG